MLSVWGASGATAASFRRRRTTVARLDNSRRSGRFTPRPGAHTAVDVVECEIERLAAGGDGVGRLPDGRVLFVPFTAPGDRVVVRVVQQRRRYARGEVQRLVKPGAGRSEPLCPVFGSCGGCSWQHLAYPVQLEAKRSILRESLRRIGGLGNLGEIEITASPQPYHYRSRARLQSEGGRVGFRRRHSHELCAVKRCPVLVEALDQALEELPRIVERGCASTLPREWELAVGEDGCVRAAPLGSQVAGASPTETSIVYRVEENHLCVSPGVFHQANQLLQSKLVRAVRDAATQGAEAEGERLLELFSGAGLFTLSLAPHFERVIAVESNPAAIGDLHRNLRGAGISHVEVRAERVEVVLAAFPTDPECRPDVVVLDPPRSGLVAGAERHLARLGARRIVYLSCDPATLARDLAALTRCGYAIDRVEGFDLFPQTAHIEALAVLRPAAAKGAPARRRDTPDPGG